mgnify:CR=1 FL=1
MKIPNRTRLQPSRKLSLARIVSEDSQRGMIEEVDNPKSSKDS